MRRQRRQRKLREEKENNAGVQIKKCASSVSNS